MNALNEDLLGHASRLCGHNGMMSTDVNRRMRENRMSGGVGGVTGAIPSPRPDLCWRPSCVARALHRRYRGTDVLEPH